MPPVAPTSVRTRRRLERPTWKACLRPTWRSEDPRCSATRSSTTPRASGTLGCPLNCTSGLEDSTDMSYGHPTARSDAPRWTLEPATCDGRCETGEVRCTPTTVGRVEAERVRRGCG